MREFWVRAALRILVLASLLAFPAGASPEGVAFEFGGNRQSALATLSQLDVQTLALHVYPRVEVISRRSFEHLQDTEGVIVGSGELRAGFRGDALDYLQIAPVHERWQQYFEGATSRAAVLAGLERLFLAEPGVQIRSAAIRNTHVNIQDLDENDHQLLERYDQWSGSYSDAKGYWHLTVNFEHGRLAEVRRRWFPGPL